MSIQEHFDEVKTYFTKTKPSDLSYSEYLHIAHGLGALNKSEDRIKDSGIISSDFLPEPIPLTNILRLSSYSRENGESQ